MDAVAIVVGAKEKKAVDQETAVKGEGKSRTSKRKLLWICTPEKRPVFPSLNIAWGKKISKNWVRTEISKS